jgi:hypothetical protein
MTDNINKISQNVDGNKVQQQQQTSASIANLTDDGKRRSFLFSTLICIEKRTDKNVTLE